MNNNKSLIWAIGVIVVILVIGAIAYSMNRDGDTEVEQPADTTQSTENAPADSSAATETTIQYGDNGYAMPTYTVSPGATVTVVNNSSSDMQFSSNNHPTHRDEPALNTEVTAPGESTTFTAPSEPGEYGFHDHIKSQFSGILVVE